MALVATIATVSDCDERGLQSLVGGWVHQAEVKLGMETEARCAVNADSREEVSLEKGESIAGGLTKKSQAAFRGRRQRLKPTPLGKAAYTNTCPSQSIKKSGFGCK
jgi:hypothetical protein